MTLEGNGPNNIVRVDAKTKAYLHPGTVKDARGEFL